MGICTWLPLLLAVGQVQTIDLDQRPRLIVAFTGQSSPEAARLLAPLAARVESVTPYRVETAEAIGLTSSALEACELERRLGCWAFQTQKHRAPGPDGPTWLLVVSTVAHDPARFTASAILLNVDEAVSWLVDSSDERARVENRIFGHAERIAPAVLPNDGAALAAYLEAAFEPAIRGRLGAQSVPRGALEVDGGAHLTLSLDGRPVATSVEGALRIENMAPRTHELTLAPPGSDPIFQTRVEVLAGKTARVDARAVRPEPEARGSARDPIMWTGLGAAATGVAIIALSVALVPDQVALSQCGPTECPAAQSRRFLGTCTAFGGDVVSCADHRGVLMAPLGLGLVGAGGVAAAFAALSEPDGNLPWWGVGLGLAVGIATYGIAAAAE